METAHTDYPHQQHAATRTVMREQDEYLEVLDGAASRVHEMVQEIHGELKSQSTLIEDLEADIDDTTDKMNFVTRKLTKLLKTKGSSQPRIIVFLTLIFLVMILVLIWS